MSCRFAEPVEGVVRIEPADGSSRLMAMAKLIGELLFGIIRDLAWDQARSFCWRIVEKAGAWLDTKIKGRGVRLAVGLLLGVAAWGIFPLIALLLAH